jgi:hypothetical protein
MPVTSLHASLASASHAVPMSVGIDVMALNALRLWLPAPPSLRRYPIPTLVPSVAIVGTIVSLESPLGPEARGVQLRRLKRETKLAVPGPYLLFKNPTWQLLFANQFTLGFCPKLFGATTGRISTQEFAYCEQIHRSS